MGPAHLEARGSAGRRAAIRRVGRRQAARLLVRARRIRRLHPLGGARQRIDGSRRGGDQRRRGAQLVSDDRAAHRRGDDGRPREGAVDQVQAARQLGETQMKPVLLVFAAVALSVLVPPSLHAQAPASAKPTAEKPCAPTAGLSFICGLQNPEDVVLVPGTRWLLTSGMAPGAGLTLVDTQAKAARKLYAPGTANARADRTRFANCPGPLDAKQAVLHGLALRPAAGGPYTVY